YHGPLGADGVGDDDSAHRPVATYRRVQEPLATEAPRHRNVSDRLSYDLVVVRRGPRLSADVATAVDRRVEESRGGGRVSPRGDLAMDADETACARQVSRDRAACSARLARGS